MRIRIKHVHIKWNLRTLPAGHLMFPYLCHETVYTQKNNEKGLCHEIGASQLTSLLHLINLITSSVNVDNSTWVFFKWILTAYVTEAWCSLAACFCSDARRKASSFNAWMLEYVEWKEKDDVIDRVISAVVTEEKLRRFLYLLINSFIHFLIY